MRVNSRFGLPALLLLGLGSASAAGEEVDRRSRLTYSAQICFNLRGKDSFFCRLVPGAQRWIVGHTPLLRIGSSYRWISFRTDSRFVPIRSAICTVESLSRT